MAVYQADDKVMQKSLAMTHALLNIGLGYVPIPVLSKEHYLELMQAYESNLLELESRAEAKVPNELELADDGIEDAEVVVAQPAPTPLIEAPLPIPTKRKRKALKQQPTSKETLDVSLKSKSH